MFLFKKYEQEDTTNFVEQEFVLVNGELVEKEEEENDNTEEGYELQ